jgi:hypothetical protein
MRKTNKKSKKNTKARARRRPVPREPMAAPLNTMNGNGHMPPSEELPGDDASRDEPVVEAPPADERTGIWQQLCGVSFEEVDAMTVEQHIDQLRAVEGGSTSEAARAAARTQANNPKLPLFILRVRKAEKMMRQGHLTVAALFKLFPGYGIQALRLWLHVAEHPPIDPMAANAPLSEEELAELRQGAAPLLDQPDILNCLTEAIHRRGLVGEDRVVKLVFLCKLSVVLTDRPVSIMLNGPSSAGKNFTVRNTLDFVPEDSYTACTAMSERALLYDNEPLAGRSMVLFEQKGLSGDFLAYGVRSLLSEGRLVYKTVVKTPEGMKSVTIDRPGPTNLISTTTEVAVDDELETRLFSVPANDQPEQTQDIMLAQGAAAEGLSEVADVDLKPWHAMYRWLLHVEHRVVVPYGRRLARGTLAIAVRMRRDFAAILSLIKTHAVLHQESRERDEHGQIIAISDDYLAVRELVADVLAQGVDLKVPPEIRQVVEAACALYVSAPAQNSYGYKSVTVVDIARRLNMADRTTVGRWVQKAVKKGLLRNDEMRERAPAKIRPGVPLPSDEAQHVLPTSLTREPVT